MRVALLTAILLLSSCAAYVNQVETGQKGIKDANEVMDQAEADLCVQCGDGCIPKELAPMASCLAVTQTFTCEFKNNACERVN